MKYYAIILFLFLALPDSTAQIKSSRYTTNQEENYLTEARRLREKNPEKAVDFLEKALRSSKETNDYAVSAEAYFLLGNIYLRRHRTKRLGFTALFTSRQTL